MPSPSLSPQTPSPGASLRWERVSSRARLMARPRRLIALFAGILAPLALAAEMADDVLQREALRLDEPILLRLHELSSPTLNRIALIVTESGGFIGTLVIAIVGALWLWKLERTRALWFWGLALGGAGLLNVFVKLFFRRERPALWPSISPEHDFSFPSGHSMLSSALAASVLLLLWPTRARPLAIVFAIVWPLGVGVSRMYLGVHFPSDVLAGWCAGLAWTTGVYFILRGERDQFLLRVAREQEQSDDPTSPQVLGAALDATHEPIGGEDSAEQKLRDAAGNAADQ